MTEKTSFQLRDYFPCVHLLRAVGIAFDFRKLLLGAIAWIVLAAGQTAITKLPFAPEDESVVWPSDVTKVALSPIRLNPRSSGWNEHDARLRELEREAEIELGDAQGSLTQNVQGQWATQGGMLILLYPVQTIVEPGRQLFRNGLTWSAVAYAWTHLIWAFVVWALFGVALARMTAVQFATHDRIGIVKAIRFSARQLQSSCTAVFIPICAFGLFFSIAASIGWLSAFAPEVGRFIFGALWIFALLAGFCMAMLLIAVTLTWPLMIATLGTEDSDGFDAMSRSFGYLLDRPWYLLFLVGLGAVIGSIGWIVIGTITGLANHLAIWSVSSGFGVVELSKLFAGEAGWSGSAAIFWHNVLRLIMAGYVPAFFFAGSTLIYLLLRQSDDGTPLNVVLDYDAAPDNDESKKETSFGATTNEPTTELPIVGDSETDANSEGSASK